MELTYQIRNLPVSGQTYFQLVQAKHNDSVSGPVVDGNKYMGRLEADGRLVPLYREQWLYWLLRPEPLADEVLLWPSDPLELGQEWDCLESRDATGGWQLSLGGRVAEVETVRVQGVNWEDCLKLNYMLTLETPLLWRLTGDDTLIRLRLNVWLAPAIGVVKGILTLEEVDTKSAWGQQCKYLEGAELFRVELISRDVAQPESNQLSSVSGTIENLDHSSPWPMFGHDAQHTGRSPYVGPQTNSVKWKCVVGHILDSIAVSADCTIYVTCHDDDKVHAISPDGRLIGWYATGQKEISPPAIGPDGTIMVCTRDRLQALSPSLGLDWKSKRAGAVMNACPVIGTDGTVVVASGSDYILAYDSFGERKWGYDLIQDIGFNSPAIGGDGTIYAGCQDGYLHAVSADGSLQWKVRLGKQVISSPVVGKDSNIYVQSYVVEKGEDGAVSSSKNFLNAVEADGSLLWSYPLESRCTYRNTAAIGPKGVIYIGTGSGLLHAINPDGSTRWKFESFDSSPEAKSTDVGFHTPVIGADGLIYVSSFDNNLYCLNPDGSVKWMYGADHSISKTGSIGADGTLYIGMDGQLVAFSDD